MPRGRKKSPRSRLPRPGGEDLRKRLLRRVTLRRPLAQVVVLFESVTMGVPARDELYAWEFFAYDTMRRARRARKMRDKLAWSSMAFRVFDQLATCPPAGNWSPECSAVNGAHFRVWMIKRLIPWNGESVFDAEAVFAWFQESAFVSSQDAAQMVSVGLGNLSSWTLALLKGLWHQLRRLSRLPGMRELMRKHPRMKGWLRFMKDFRRANEALYVYRVYEALIQLRRARADLPRAVAEPLE